MAKPNPTQPPISLPDRRRGAKPVDNSGCPRERAARQRRARQRRNARQLHASLSVR